MKRPKRESHCVWYKIFIIWLLVVSLILISLIRESSIVKSCSVTDLVLQIVLVWIAIVATIVGAVIVLKEERNKFSPSSSPFQEFKISSCKRVIGLSLFIFFGTSLATAIGSGGGTIYNPLLLSLGLPVEVTRATSLYLIMYKSLATVIQFAILGMIDWSYGAWFSVFAVFASVYLSHGI